MKMQIDKKRPQTIEDIRGHNDMVDWLTRAVSAGLVVLEKGDSVPQRYEEPEFKIACGHCGESSLTKLGVLYFERINRALLGFTAAGRLQVGDYDGGYDVSASDADEAKLSGYFIKCDTCEQRSPLPEDIKLEW